MILDIFSTPQRYTFDSRDPAVVAAAAGNANEIGDLSDVVEVDVTLSEDYSFAYEISSSPVERGLSVADHKREKAKTLHMRGIVSDSPNNALEVFRGNLSGTVLQGSQETRSQDAYRRLAALAARSEPITVVTQLDTFESMTFTAFSVQKDDAGKYLSFSATLEEVRFATASFGVFVDIEHTAPTKAVAQKAPPTLDNEAILRAGQQGADGASSGFLESTKGFIRGAYQKGLSVLK